MTSEEERLSPEWHARECDESARNVKERSRTSRVDVAKEFQDLIAEEHLDRAKKLRSIPAMLEALEAAEAFSAHVERVYDLPTSDGEAPSDFIAQAQRAYDVTYSKLYTAAIKLRKSALDAARETPHEE